MTRDEGVAIIKQQLAFKQTLDSVIVTNMKYAQTMLEAAPTKPWFLVSEDNFATTTVDEERLLLPSTFLQEVENARLYYRPSDDDEDEVELKKDDYDQLKRDYLGVEPGAPTAYALLGGYFRLFPLPDDEYTIRLIFFAQDTVLSSNVENGWLKWNPMLLLGSTLKLVAGGPIRDKDAMGVANEWIAIGTKLLVSQDVARESANREDQMGGRHW